MSALQFEALVNQRLHKRFNGITVSGEPLLWWHRRSRRWVTTENLAGRPASSHADCRSLKAFKRHLRKHAAELAGREVVLESFFIGCDVKADLRAALPTTSKVME